MVSSARSLASIARDLRDADIPPELRDAPIDDEPLTPEDLAAIAESRAELAAGAKTMTTEELRRSLGL